MGEMQNKDSDSGARAQVIIPDGTDLNTIGTPGKRFKHLPKDIYSDLPSHFQLVEKVDTEQDKAVVFLAFMVAISGALPGVRFNYGGKWYSPHLYCYVLGPYGSGKGMADYGVNILQPIHDHYRDQYAAKSAEYEAALYAWEAEMARMKKSGMKTEPEKPEEPVPYRPLIAGYNTKAGILQNIAGNEGTGTIIETEGDTVAAQFQTDVGNYSDLMRKAFEHERFSYYRKTDKEEYEIKNPRIAILLSSTFDQLVRMMPSPENGLFSRFMYYVIDGHKEFRDLFKPNKKDYAAIAEQSGRKLLEIHKYLADHEGIEVEFTKDQQEAFLEYFQDKKASYVGKLGDDFAGVVHRLAVITIRMNMVFAVLRAFDTGQVANKLTPTNEDFTNFMRVADVLFHNAGFIHEKLIYGTRVEQVSDTARRERAQYHYQNGVPVTEIAGMMNVDRRTIYRWAKAGQWQKGGAQ